MAYISSANITFSDRVRAVAADLQERLQRRRMFRNTLSELQSLSGRELADLGLSRAQLRSVAYEAAYGK